MPTVWIPALLRPFSQEQETVQVSGHTLREVIDDLDRKFPGIKGRLCQDGELRPGLAVVVDTQVVRSGLSEEVAEKSEVHFIPAIGGGSMRTILIAVLLTLVFLAPARAQEPAVRIYENRLTLIKNPAPLLADHPEYVEPIRTGPRFEAPMLIDDPDGKLAVRAWRFSYNARGIIEMPNRLSAKATAIIVVHPWGVDDGQGWKSPEPAGAAFHCTPFKNALTLTHMRDVINPFLKAGRSSVGVVGYSLPGTADPIRKKMYRSVSHQPSADERKVGAKELAAKLSGFSYEGQPLPEKITLSSDKPAGDYFRQFPGLDPGVKFNNAGFWDLPIPVAKPIEVAERDLVFYDGDGYPVLRDYLKKQGIRHVLLTGYSTDMCVCSTTAGYKNLAKDFNVFLVGDATLATFPAHDTPRFATSAAVSFASIDLFITQVSWVRFP